MIVVSDTSPLNYLVLIGEIACLPKLFGTVLIPPAVRDELGSADAPEAVLEWLASSPEWLEIRQVAEVPVDSFLGAGEAQAIALARDQGALLLADDFAARTFASEASLLVTGTLGVLERAAAAGLLSLPEAIAKLRRTNFRLSSVLIDAALERDRTRTGQAS